MLMTPLRIMAGMLAEALSSVIKACKVFPCCACLTNVVSFILNPY